MKYLTIALSIVVAVTFMGMDSLNQSQADAQDKKECVKSDKKTCDKQECCKSKCENKDECKKDSCKHKCDKEVDKCEKCGKCEHKCKCKKDCRRTDDHKCGEGKCGGDTGN